MRKIFLLLLVCILGVTSCKKNYTTVVKGRIINKYTQKPIEGVSITLKDAIMSDDLITSSTTTDANGNFEVSIKSKSKIAYFGLGHEFYGDAIDQYGNAYGNAYSTISYGKVHDLNMTMIGRVHFEADFKNTKYSDGDSTYISILSYSDLNQLIYHGERKLYTGTGTYFSSTIYGEGDRYLRYKIENKRNNIWTTKIDSVFLQSSGQTQFFDINF